MKQLIEDSKAYKALEPLAQKMVIKRVNRIQVEDNIIQARNLGLELWQSQTGLCNKWKTIVIEIITNEQQIENQKLV